MAEEVCPTGYYANETIHDCIPCSACEAGEGTAEPCGNRSDTVCKPCSEGHYSEHTSSGRECAGCRSCTPERTELAPCTSTRDSVCGSCSVGYFLYVDHTGSECLQCSKCPPDGEVVRWADCAATGVPEDYRCAPGKRSMRVFVTFCHRKSPCDATIGIVTEPKGPPLLEDLTSLCSHESCFLDNTCCRVMD